MNKFRSLTKNIFHVIVIIKLKALDVVFVGTPYNATTYKIV